MPPESADVSVVIPAYRAAETIGRALASVAAQTLRPRQVIVVDDGSPDGTYEAAMAAAESMAGIDLVVVRQGNLGAGAARNRALAEAACTYVAFLDADDEWLPEKLERSMAHLAEPGMVLVAHDGWIVDGGEETYNACARRFGEKRDPFATLYRKGYIDTCSVVARLDAVTAAGGFDESLPNAQDFDLWLAMLRRPGARFVVFAEPLVRYHLSPEGIMSNTARRLRCCMEIALRYAPDLRGRPGSALFSLWFRVLALHHEAFTAYRARGDRGGMVRTCQGLPLALAKATLRLLTAPEFRATKQAGDPS